MIRSIGPYPRRRAIGFRRHPSAMIELRTPIATSLVGPMEEWFNGMTRCPWALEVNAAGTVFQLIGFFDDATAAQAAWDDLCADFPALPAQPTQTQMNDRDWREAYKAHLHPWSVGDLHWVPVWRKDEYRLPPGHTRLLFDAGLAFGTGDHATTRLMATRLLDFRAARGPAEFASAPIIDAGCGSGILALSAALLGCRKVFAFDRDPEAITVSRENLQVNNLSPEAVEFDLAGLEAALKNRRAQLLLANIQADVLALHADELAAAIAPGGVLAMSGILASEVGDVRTAFESVLSTVWNADVPDDLENFGASRIQGDWCDLVFVRPGK